MQFVMNGMRKFNTSASLGVDDLRNSIFLGADLYGAFETGSYVLAPKDDGMRVRAFQLQ
jgi:hypothetical protein